MVGEKVARGLRERVLQKAMGMDMTYFEVEGVDVRIATVKIRLKYF